MNGYYTTQEAAELAGVTCRRLRYAIQNGKLRETKRIGRFRLFDNYDIAEIKRFFGKSRSVREELN